MKPILTKTLITASAITLVMAISPAMANPSVLCSVRANYDAASGDAAYTPGVDVQGQAVAPADLAGQQNILPNSIRIPFTVDLARRMNEVLPENAKLEAQLGVIDVDQDGKVFFNGRDLTAATTVMCDTLEKQREAALKTPDAPKARSNAAATPAPAKQADEAPEVQAAPVTPVEPQMLQDSVAEQEVQPEPSVEPQTEPEIAAPVAQEQEQVQEIQESGTAVIESREMIVSPDPVPVPAPEELLNPPAPVPGFSDERVNPVETPPMEGLAVPQNDAILSPSMEGRMPRPPLDPQPLDPLTSEPDYIDGDLPGPTPIVNDDGMLSGGAQ